MKDMAGLNQEGILLAVGESIHGKMAGSTHEGFRMQAKRIPARADECYAALMAVLLAMADLPGCIEAAPSS